MILGENIIILLDYIIIFLIISLYPIGVIYSIIESKGIKIKIKSKEKEVKKENIRDILIKKYLYGEITKEQYEQMKKNLI